MRYKNRILYVIGVILFILLCVNWNKHVAPLYKDIQIDSFYVDYRGEFYYHIKYFRNDEDCVKKVIRFVDSLDYATNWFVSNKKGIYIEDNRVHIDDEKTDHFLLEKCDTVFETYSYFLFRMSKSKPVNMEEEEGEEITYIKGDFVKLDFDVLESFFKCIPINIMSSSVSHTYILLNVQGEKKVELSTVADIGCCKFKVY